LRATYYLISVYGLWRALGLVLYRQIKGTCGTRVRARIPFDPTADSDESYWGMRFSAGRESRWGTKGTFPPSCYQRLTRTVPGDPRRRLTLRFWLPILRHLLWRA